MSEPNPEKGTQPQSPPQGQPAGPTRPDDVPESDWDALGDPGKNALVRERNRATAAERALAAARAARPEPPKVEPAKQEPAPQPKPGEQPDIGALIQAAVTQALAPIQEAQAQRDAAEAAGRIRETVTTAASERFHDATDALAHVDLAGLTDGTGRPDPAKITTALDDLLTRKPHLGRVVDDRRRAAPGSAHGAGGGTTSSLDDRVKAQLELMNRQ